MECLLNIGIIVCFFCYIFNFNSMKLECRDSFIKADFPLMYTSQSSKAMANVPAWNFISGPKLISFSTKSDKTAFQTDMKRQHEIKIMYIMKM